MKHFPITILACSLGTRNAYSLSKPSLGINLQVWDWWVPSPGVRKLFGKCQITNILNFAWYIVCVITTQLYHKSSHRQYVNELVWLCSNKTFFTKTGIEPDLDNGPQFVNLWPRVEVVLKLSFVWFLFFKKSHFSQSNLKQSPNLKRNKQNTRVALVKQERWERGTLHIERPPGCPLSNSHSSSL